jgi:hypothetical protein
LPSFAAVAERVVALHENRRWYDERRLIERHGYRLTYRPGTILE